MTVRTITPVGSPAMPARLPDNEATRLAAWRMLEVLDNGPEAALDALVRVAPIVCGTPISLTSLVDAERQWFKTNIGLPEPTRRSETSRNAQRRPETPTRVDFRAHAILDEQIFEVSDAALDCRVADHRCWRTGRASGSTPARRFSSATAAGWASGVSVSARPIR